MVQHPCGNITNRCLTTVLGTDRDECGSRLQRQKPLVIETLAKYVPCHSRQPASITSWCCRGRHASQQTRHRSERASWEGEIENNTIKRRPNYYTISSGEKIRSGNGNVRPFTCSISTPRTNARLLVHYIRNPQQNWFSTSRSHTVFYCFSALVGVSIH